ncbi:hypothetical protein AFLA_010838 [Aspergillus flavus NRRL3357]|nr:hypothetical protein AFLA_010838 [Aspergillus flavus NRRL3357]
MGAQFVSTVVSRSAIVSTIERSEPLKVNTKFPEDHKLETFGSALSSGRSGGELCRPFYTFYTASYHPSHKVTLVVFFCYLGEPFTLSWPSMLPKNKVHRARQGGFYDADFNITKLAPERSTKPS